jgi:hypothetical protein
MNPQSKRQSNFKASDSMALKESPARIQERAVNEPMKVPINVSKTQY